MVFTFEFVDVTIQMKATEQHFPVVLFVFQYFKNEMEGFF